MPVKQGLSQLYDAKQYLMDLFESQVIEQRERAGPGIATSEVDHKRTLPCVEVDPAWDNRTCTPTERLWLAVLGQAIFDAFLHTTGGDYYSVAWVKDARKYFDGPDFHWICSELGINIEWARRKIGSLEVLARELRGDEYDKAVVTVATRSALKEETMADEVNALIVTRRPAKEMADGTLRVQFDVEPNDRKAFLNMFPDNGDPMAVARLDPETIRRHQQETAFAEPEKKTKGEHGSFAKWLVQSGFFRKPDVWAFLGSDKRFLEWLKLQECAFTNAPDRHDGDIVPAHVRRIADGAGTAVKPKYSAIPLCNKHHNQQHQHGESHLGGKEWFDRQRIIWVEKWARDVLRERAGVDSLTKLSPYHLESVMRESGINVNIPVEFF